VNAAVGAVVLTLAGVMFWRRRTPKLMAFLCLVGGIALRTTFLGEWVRTALETVGDLLADVASPAFGKAVALSAAAAALYLYVHDMAPKRRAFGTTALCGLLLPALWAGQGGAIGRVVNRLFDGLEQAAASLGSSLLGI
jgi:hypothetical protein